MREPQELRIGNLVQAEINEMDWQTCAIKGVWEDEARIRPFSNLIATVSLTHDEIHPIPLNEQWLEDFGFEKVQDNVWRLEIAPDAHIELIKSHDFFYPVLSNSPEFSHEDLSVVPVNRLYSVHWLQNLVYFNYEKELELKKQ